jgi:hypothetical protein
MRRIFFAFALFGATEVLADERKEIVAQCVASFASGDMAAFQNAVSEVKSWDKIADENLQLAASACLGLATPATNAAIADKETSDPTSQTSENILPDRVAFYLEKLATDPDAIGTIAKEIADDEALTSVDDAKTKELEALLINYARPIPAKEAEKNKIAYRALSRLDPENQSYLAKVEQYDAALQAQARENEERRRTIVKKLIKSTAEFDGSSWYRHPSSPRYQDTKSYVTLYILETGTGQRTLEFFLNYTSRSGWLFVESAQINVDGAITRLPASQWIRDNDTEIWEYIGYRNNQQMIDLAKKISESDRAVVRFNGQQFYDDHVITTTEKQIIRDMLLAWDEMQ